MKNFTSVLAFGDSHVAGAELSAYTKEDYTRGTTPIEELDMPGKLLAFPQIVADHFDVPCYNYALSGGSNTRSMRLLPQALKDHPNSLVLFGYTCTDRTEFYYPDDGFFRGRDQDNFLQVGTQWTDTNMNHVLNDMYIKMLLRINNNLEQLAFYVESACKVHASDYVHIPLFPEQFPNIDNLIDLQGATCYLDWCSKQGFFTKPYRHYGQDAHAAFAKLIISQLK